MTLFAIVPVHNRIAMTLEFLDSLDAQETQEEIEVIILDDGSTDATAEILSKRRGRFPLSVLSGSGNLWWAGSVKVSLKSIRSRLDVNDWVYLGNNDTILDVNHISRLLQTAQSFPAALIGSRSFEVWPDGTRHPVSGGFTIDPRALSISIVDGEDLETKEVDALAGRGLLIPAKAALRMRLYPKLMPQHFADLAATSLLRKEGFRLLVDPRACSTQVDRAGSALESGETQRLTWNKSDPLYIPALAYFWLQRVPLHQLVLQLPRIWKRHTGRNKIGV